MTTVPAQQQLSNLQVTLPRSPSILSRSTSTSGYSSAISVRNTNTKRSTSNTDDLFVKRGKKGNNVKPDYGRSIYCH